MATTETPGTAALWVLTASKKKKKNWAGKHGKNDNPGKQQKQKKKGETGG